MENKIHLGVFGMPIVVACFCGCVSIPLTLQKLPDAPAIITQDRSITRSPKKLLFLSAKEAKCPHQCSEMVKDSGGYGSFIAYAERQLINRGFELVNGAVVSKVEDKLKDNKTRETWDAEEKAFLLGKETGADGIIVVRQLYVDEVKLSFLVARRGNEEGRYTQVSTSYANDPRPGGPRWRANVPLWVAVVEMRMLDTNGKVIWSGEKKVRTDNLIPGDWECKDMGYDSFCEESNFDYKR